MRPFTSTTLACLVASLLACAGTALAQQGITYSAQTYANEQEALNHPLPVPKECLDATGQNRCHEFSLQDHGRYRAGPWMYWSCRRESTGNRRSCGSDFPDADRSEVVGPNSYARASEAMKHPLPAPKSCIDSAGNNICIQTYVAEIGPRGMAWRPFAWLWRWSVICRDAGTDESVVDCGAPNAVPTVPDSAGYRYIY